MNKYKKILPDISKVNFDNLNLKENSHLILVAGFEERAIGFLRKINPSENKAKIKSASIIEYEPALPKNNKHLKEIGELLNRLSVQPKDVTRYKFDRSNPIDFDQTLKELFSTSIKIEHIYCDISGMSKLLLLYILKVIWNLNKSFSIIYTEAKSYAPNKKKYEEIKAKEQYNLNEFFPMGVYDPIIPTLFSGFAPLGVNRVLIGFLSYNKRQLLGATNIIPYQLFIPFIGIPPYKEWRWRTEALIEINNEGLLASHKYIKEIPKINFKKLSDKKKQYLKEEYAICLSTLDYKKTLAALHWVAEKHRYNYCLTIAPFGSKLQTVGIFLFYILNPETQIVYCSPEDYNIGYSKGMKNSYIVNFTNVSNLENTLKRISDPNFKSLEKILSETNY